MATDERRRGGPAGGPGRGPTAPRQPSRTAPKDRSRRAEPTRFTAYTLLRAVADGAYANLELPTMIRERRLDARDAAFATELAFGTLRWQGFYDAVVAEAAGRPVERIDGPLLDVLRLGVHQLLGMRVPPHAAADQSVGLARTVVGTGASGLVNAVLRRVGERTREEWLAQVVPDGTDPLTGLAVTHSHPLWVVKVLRQALLGHGASSTDTVDGDLAALLAADNDPPLVVLAARPGLTTVEDLVASADARPSTTSPVGVVLASGDPARVPAVRDGRAAVQDEGSQQVALALARASVTSDLPPRWLDLCAGPGGKSGLLAGLARSAGATLVANEVSEHRADLVRQTLRGYPEVEVRTGDGREVGAAEPGAYVRVLVDAPCTGLGALRRRPEARWRRRPSDVAALAPLQRDLLRSGLDAVAPGGVVGYATCSPHLAETKFVVEDVVKKRADVVVEDARPLFVDAAGEPLAHLGPGPFVQLWPHLHGTDAMFFALLRRL